MDDRTYLLTYGTAWSDDGWILREALTESARTVAQLGSEEDAPPFADAVEAIYDDVV